MKKENKNSTSFLDIFGLEYIEITLTEKLTRTMTSEEGVISESFPLFIKGFLIEEDAEWIYVGNSTDEIDQAVPKKQVCCVQITQPQIDNTPEILDILDNAQEPNRDEEYN